ncbi:MAG: NAD(P)-dependent alcohol dehydrogenase [bacterium]|nr:NAD(P)-dependent alcohol dehydrogenase [bacterium]
MKAVVQTRYGPFDQLEYRDIPKPTPGPGEVLIRTHAASLHAGDCMCVLGSPKVVRAATGVFQPKNQVPGFDVAGVVESVGEGVGGLRPGDEVFGASEGACATHAIVKEDRLAPKPHGLNFMEAAAVPTSALAALHGLRDSAGLRPGQEVLINGAAGGVGHFAIQIAKHLGARVTAVCSTGRAAMVQALGADQVIDYTQADFCRQGARYDVILDNVENRSLAHIRSALKPGGTLLCNSGTGSTGFAFMARLFKPLLLSPFVGQSLKRFVSTPNLEDLVALKELIEKGDLKPVIGQTYGLSDVPIALAQIASGHFHGKLVIETL